MNAPHSILRDIQVSVVRAEAQRSVSGKRSSHPAYVFAIQPRVPQTPLQRSRMRLFSQSSATSLLSPTSTSVAQEDGGRLRCPSSLSMCSTASSTCPPVLHEVSRTYSQCRRLYQDLMAYTNCTSAESCCCLNGSCPFWTMYLLLQAFPFPRKTLLNFQSRETCRHRLQALNGLMLTIFEKLQTYKEEYFLERSGCRVLAALEDFLDLSDDFANRFREMDCRLQLKLNLNGWRSDRKNLYFQDDEDVAEASLQKPSQPVRREPMPAQVPVSPRFPMTSPVAMPSPMPLPVASPHEEKPVPFEEVLSPLSDVDRKSEFEASYVEPLLSPLCQPQLDSPLCA